LIVTALGVAALVVAPLAAQPTQDLFAPIAIVMQHPRCLNCHVNGDRPLNGEGGGLHRMKITRGGDPGRGAPGAHCYACHRETAVSESSFVPSAPDWHLPPKDMGWQDQTQAQLCDRLKISLEKLNWKPAKIIDHFTKDPLVSTSWKGTPPRRPEVPSHQGQVGEGVEAWLKAGQPCP